MFKANMLKNREVLEAEKSATVLFNEAMKEFQNWHFEESFVLFERAVAKGHKESIWILSVMKDVDMEKSALIEAFAKKEEPLGRYFAGQLSEEDSREQFDFFKKSAEGGCSWGQVEYGNYFYYGGGFVEKDKKVYLEWLEKAANQNNPRAMDWLGNWFQSEGGDKEKAVSYYRAGADLGWTTSMGWLAEMLRDGEGCAKDLRQAAVWGAKGASSEFWWLLQDAGRSLESKITEYLYCDVNQLCYTLGWGLYWYQCGSETWTRQNAVDKAFNERCLDYYCSCVELQQESIFTLLLCWKQKTGVKGPGTIIANMVWEDRTDNLLNPFTEQHITSAHLKNKTF